MERVIVNLGCGSSKQAGAIGLDSRITPAVNIVSDAVSVPLRDHSVDELAAYCLLEHFDRPKDVLREVHRVLKPSGTAIFRVPNLGTFSAHLDTTHRFLADLKIWKDVIHGYFYNVKVVPLGTKYRDNLLLMGINQFMVKGLKMYELARDWDFICSGLKPNPTASSRFEGWWEEDFF